MSRDTAQLWEDWDRQVRFKREKEVRAELTKLNKENGKINSTKFNLKKGTKQQIRKHTSVKKEIKKLEIRENFQACNNDPTSTFYQAISDHQRSKRRVDYC